MFFETRFEELHVFWYGPRKDVNLAFRGKISIDVKLRIYPFSILLEVIIFLNVLLMVVFSHVEMGSIEKDYL